MGLRRILPGVAVGCFGAGLLLWPAEAMDAGRDGLALCANTIVPSLFPFFVLSSLVVGLGYAQGLGRVLGRWMKPVFGVNGCCASALVLGLVGGYPVGARTAAELVRQGLCSRQEGQRMLGFCSNAGPAFLIGVVGTGIFGSGRVGVALWLVHILAALITGLLLRLAGGNIASPATTTSAKSSPSPARVLTESVRSAGAAVLQVCAYILLFGILLRLLRCAGLLRVENQWLERLLVGVVELSNGLALLPADAPLQSLPLAALLLGWGGISVMCQTMSVVEEAGLSIGSYIYGKLIHGMISALLCTVMLHFMPFSSVASGLLSSTVKTDYVYFAPTCVVPALGMGLLLFCAGKIGGGNPGERRV